MLGQCSRSDIVVLFSPHIIVAFFGLLALVIALWNLYYINDLLSLLQEVSGIANSDSAPLD